MTPPLFHPNFWDVIVAPDRPCWSQPQRKPYVTEGETDGQKTYTVQWHNRALRNIAR